MSQFKNIPYDARNNEQAGKYRGVGERGKTGTRPGTFTVQENPKPKSKGKPSRKIP